MAIFAAAEWLKGGLRARLDGAVALPGHLQGRAGHLALEAFEAMWSFDWRINSSFQSNKDQLQKELRPKPDRP